nr:hypothetical protein [Tanacetum cinerariifolium]
SEKCVLIGYASGKKASKLFILENRNVLYSRDVKFYETVFPYKMSNNESVNEYDNVSIIKNFDHFRVELETKTSNLTPNDEEEGSPGRDGRVHQRVTRANTDQPVHDDTRPTTPSDENNNARGNVGSPYESAESSLYEKALKDVNWINAINEKMHALYENKTSIMSDLLVVRKPFGSKWVFRNKYKSNGEVERYKARDLKEEVYMLPLPGVFKSNESKECKLEKSLYGLKHAPRQ